jgi:Xaa-Pro aminopeptidase
MANDSRPDWSGRLQRLQASLAPAGLQALLVSTPVNLTYLTGFSGSAGLLLLTPRARLLVLDGRYEVSAREQLAAGDLADTSIARVDTRFDLTLATLIAREALGDVGFEAAHTTVATLRRWQTASPGVTWHPTEGLVERLRVLKDTREVEILRRAGGALAGVAKDLGRFVTRGRTEREMAAAIDEALRRAGFERPAFATIVASGPLSAHPHARPTDRRPTEGDLVLLDFGGVLDGYCVDLTRVAVIGPARPEVVALHDAVAAAHRAALRAVRPGVAAWTIDRAARQVLEDRGLGAAFVHATGHGLGLEVHEAPRIARPESDGTDTIEAGMVFTIEPGAYREHLGGVRLEDDVLVTADGGEVLTEAPRTLLVV